MAGIDVNVQVEEGEEDFMEGRFAEETIFNAHSGTFFRRRRQNGRNKAKSHQKERKRIWW